MPGRAPYINGTPYRGMGLGISNAVACNHIVVVQVLYVKSKSVEEIELLLVHELLIKHQINFFSFMIQYSICNVLIPFSLYNRCCKSKINPGVSLT